MYEISCEMCMDLMPLVNDGVASADSRAAVEKHIQSCEICRACFSGEQPPEANTQKALHRLTQRIRTFSMLLMMFGICFGLGLTGSMDLFYNSVLMPVVGALGYLIFRWKAAYLVPLLLLAADCLIFLLEMLRGSPEVDFYSLLVWTGIYCVFALIGVVIAGLLHFAFRKEK